MQIFAISPQWATAARVVPPAGHTAQLTVFVAGAMAFLAVFALALSLASSRLAERWEAALAHSSTVRISAPADQVAAQVRAAEAVLAATPGIEKYRTLGPEETQALLSPWFGPDLPVESLPLPVLIEVTSGGDGVDAEGLRLRLQAEAPSAVLDDHTRWREPLVAAAARLRFLGLLSLVLIGAATAAMVTLAAQASLAANRQVIRVLRLVGARDTFIARAFVRRFTLRALGGAAGGTVLGLIAIALLPRAAEEGGFLTGLGFTGWGWFWPLLIPPFAAVTAFVATRVAAFKNLRGLA
ncbi:cell division protein FtsX [Ostreiculturibacter nitratireducens]|uniref:cell division protein FtsX n=1 Tax=Ostreiculturibacter nitratireducens TaxID=3075226 RepID=UPI0031B58511